MSGSTDLDVRALFTRVVIEHLGVAHERVVAGARFVEDLGADENGLVELVMASEEELGLTLPIDAFKTHRTVDEAVLFLSDQLQ